jgi:hypothetical protein
MGKVDGNISIFWERVGPPGSVYCGDFLKKEIGSTPEVDMWHNQTLKRLA